MALVEEDLLRQIEALEREGAAHDRAEPERRRKRLNLERPAAEVLHLFLRATGRRRVLEIGTSNGL
jgi:predicted O-methyltransferase YrrM